MDTDMSLKPKTVQTSQEQPAAALSAFRFEMLINMVKVGRYKNATMKEGIMLNWIGYSLLSKGVNFKPMLKINVSV